MRKLVNFKYLVMAMFVAMLSMSFTSCSDDDDDDVPTIADYYIECKMSGGGLSNQELTQMEAYLNSQLAGTTFDGLKRDEAIYIFDKIIKDLKDKFSEGMDGIVGTLNMVLYLKTTDGVIVKTATIAVTKDGCK
ncbi:MAG: hypothetical protein ACI4V5_07040 [Prevotella sp.]